MDSCDVPLEEDMQMRARTLLPLAFVAIGAMAAPESQADTVGSSYRGFTSVAKGVKEIGVDNLFLLRHESVPLTDAPDTTVSTMDIAYVGGLTPRYFVTDNVALALNLDFFYRKSSVSTETKDPAGGDPVEDTQTETDTGFLGFVMANYYLKLGNSMFFKPGIGGGGFVGTRSRPTAGQPGQETKTSLSGGAGRLDLGFAFYTSQSFNLKAGVDVIARFGKEKPEEDATLPSGEEPESQSFTTIDAGFNVGFAYSF
jgi:hypothetical protein